MKNNNEIIMELTKQWLQNMVLLKADLELRTVSDVATQLGLAIKVELLEIKEEESS